MGDGGSSLRRAERESDLLRRVVAQCPFLDVEAPDPGRLTGFRVLLILERVLGGLLQTEGHFDGGLFALRHRFSSCKRT